MKLSIMVFLHAAVAFERCNGAPRFLFENDSQRVPPFHLRGPVLPEIDCALFPQFCTFATQDCVDQEFDCPSQAEYSRGSQSLEPPKPQW